MKSSAASDASDDSTTPLSSSGRKNSEHSLNSFSIPKSGHTDASILGRDRHTLLIRALGTCVAALMTVLAAVGIFYVQQWNHFIGICVCFALIVAATIFFFLCWYPWQSQYYGWGSRIGAGCAILACALFIILLLAIHFFSPDVTITEFPASCHSSSNCYRTDGSSTEAVHVNTSISILYAFTNHWARSYAGSASQLLLPSDVAENIGLLHLRFISTFFGFADDFYVLLSCDASDGTTLVSVQSQSRLGVYDWGVNKERVHAFLSTLQKDVVEMPYSQCL